MGLECVEVSVIRWNRQHYNTKTRTKNETRCPKDHSRYYRRIFFSGAVKILSAIERKEALNHLVYEPTNFENLRRIGLNSKFEKYVGLFPGNRTAYGVSNKNSINLFVNLKR